jgi:hypothetical protein
MKPTIRRIAALAVILFVAAILLLAGRNLTLRADIFDSPPPVFVPYVSQGLPAAEPDQPNQAAQTTTFDSPLPVFLPHVSVQVDAPGPVLGVDHR